MDHVTKAKLQLRLVVATYRQHLARNPGDGDAAAAFRERAWPLLDSVELAHATEPEVAQVLAEARHELGGTLHDAAASEATAGRDSRSDSALGDEGPAQ